jgi:hypothetical protein
MSLLDYQKDELCPQIWKGDTLKEGVSNYIVNQVKLFFESNEIDDYDEWVYDIYIGSSIATYFYTDTSDLDIKIIIDLDEFRLSNPRFDWLEDDDFLNKLVDMGRESSYLTSFIPGTKHPIDAYFFSTDEMPEEHLIKYDSLYSIRFHEWEKEPQKINDRDKIIEIAKQKAHYFISTLDIKIAQAKRNTIDLISFLDYIKSMDIEDLYEVRKEFIELFHELNESLSTLIDIREDIKQMRKDAFSRENLSSELEKLMGSLNYSDGNIIFKMLQRYGYMKILTEINEIYEKKRLGIKEIKQISRVLQ